MTIAPRADRPSFQGVDGAVAALSAQGLRRSSARRLVLEALFSAPGPASAEHLARGLAMEPGSVYRTLETLERHGIVHHVHLGHGPGLYALVGEADRGYLYCDGCRQVIAVSGEELGLVHRHLRDRFGYQAHFDHFAIVGLCATCAARPASRPPRPTEERTPDDEHGQGEPHGHDHEHSHGDHVHSHPHFHSCEKGMDNAHEHAHG